MVLFQPIIEIRVCPMLDTAVHCLTYCPRIGGMSVRRSLIGSMPNNPNGLLEKLFGRLHVPLLTQPRINQIAIRIDSPIQITPLPMDLQIRFVDRPRFSCLSTPFDPYLIRYQRCEPCFPVSNSLMCE